MKTKQNKTDTTGENHLSSLYLEWAIKIQYWKDRLEHPMVKSGLVYLGGEAVAMAPNEKPLRIFHKTANQA